MAADVSTVLGCRRHVISLPRESAVARRQSTAFERAKANCNDRAGVRDHETKSYAAGAARDGSGSF